MSVIVNGATVAGLAASLGLLKRGVPVLLVRGASPAPHAEDVVLVGPSGVSALRWLDVEVDAVALTAIEELAHTGGPAWGRIRCDGASGPLLALRKSSLIAALEQAYARRGAQPIVEATTASSDGAGGARLAGRFQRSAACTAFLNCDVGAALPSGLSRWTCLAPGTAPPLLQRFWGRGRLLSVHPAGPGHVAVEALVPAAVSLAPRPSLRTAASMLADLAAFFPAAPLQHGKEAQSQKKRENTFSCCLQCGLPEAGRLGTGRRCGAGPRERRRERARRRWCWPGACRAWAARRRWRTA